MDGWKTTLLLEWPIFRGYVSFREGNSPTQIIAIPRRFPLLNPNTLTKREGSGTF